MKSLPQKVSAVKKLFAELDHEISSFQNASGLHCIAGCGECCKKPDIEATPLEFLPLALKFYDEGIAHAVCELIDSEAAALCLVFRPHITSFGGLCSEYPDRGLICRLFGFSARRNKEGQHELVTCRFIKQYRALEFENANNALKRGEPVAVMSDYYSRLSAIDPELVRFYPINTAIKKAIEVVLHYYSYRARRHKKNHS